MPPTQAHPNQVKGSERKRKNREARRVADQSAADAAGITVAELNTLRARETEHLRRSAAPVHVGHYLGWAPPAPRRNEWDDDDWLR